MSSVWNICANVPQMWFGSETSNGIENSLRASSLGRFSTGREKEGEPATMFLEFEYLHRVDAKCWLAKMTLVIFLMFLRSLCAFALVSTLCWLAEIWQLSQWGATGELEAQFKFQRHSCKLSFLFLPNSQSPEELALRLCWEMPSCLLRLHP